MLTSGATFNNPNILFKSLLGFFVATNVATFLHIIQQGVWIWHGVVLPDR